jgi:hypothetical protein
MAHRGRGAAPLLSLGLQHPAWGTQNRRPDPSCDTKGFSLPETTGSGKAVAPLSFCPRDSGYFFPITFDFRVSALGGFDSSA